MWYAYHWVFFFRSLFICTGFRLINVNRSTLDVNVNYPTLNVNVNWSSFSGQSAKSLANHAVSSNIPLPLLGIKYFISTQGCMIFDTDKFAKKKQQKQFCIKYFTSVVFDKLIKRKARTKYTSYSILSRIRSLANQ